MMLSQNAPLINILVFFTAALLIPIFAYSRRSTAYLIAIFATLFAAGQSVFNLFQVLEQGTIYYQMGGWPAPIGIVYRLDYLSAFLSLIINVIAVFVIFHSKRSLESEAPEKMMPFYSVSMLLLAGFNGMVMTADLFNLYVFLEIASLSSYGLVSIGEKKAPFSAFRYLIMGTVAGSFYLFGLGFLFLKTGTLNMDDMKNILSTLPLDPQTVVALSLIIIGSAIKAAFFPLHGWLPDAYTYGSSVSSALIAPIGTKVGVYVIVRFIFFIFGVDLISEKLPLGDIIAWLSAIGIIYGSVLAIAQKEMKRMLAYSSVSQLGYIGLGIGLASPLGLTGALLHLLNHAFMKGALFLVTSNMRLKVGHTDISRMDDSLRKKMPFTMLAFTIAALSMVGLPPLAGFFSKWYLAQAAIEQTQWVFVVVIILSTLLNAIYFFRVLEKIYLKRSDDDEPAKALRDEAPASMLGPTIVMSVSLFAFGIANVVIVNEVLFKMCENIWVRLF